MINRRGFIKSVAAVGAGSVMKSRRARADAADGLSGKVFFKGDAKYESLRQAASFNAHKPDRYPNAIVLAANEADVIAAVKLARERGWQITARSGGHSWTASHTQNNSVQINLAKMQEIVVDPAARIARISPAVSGNALNNVLREQYGLFTPSAHGANVGMGGFVMCGGHGWNSRVFGLGCENLTALDVVTADGELIHASETENSDYLWAARGSGPGFFGVATRYYQKVHPRPPVCKSTGVVLPFDHFEPVFTWVRERLASFPKNLEVVFIVSRPKDDLLVTVVGTCMGETAEQVLRDLKVMKTIPDFERAPIKWEGRDRLVPANVEEQGELQPTGGRFAVDNIWTQAPAAKLVPRLKEICRQFPSAQSSLFAQCWGPIQKLPDIAYSVQADLYLAFNGTNYDPAEDAKVDAWVVDSARSMQDVSVGAQMNDENIAANPARYLSESASKRLEAMRQKYDPERRFMGFPKA